MLRGTALLPQHPRENQRRHDGSVALDDEFRRRRREFTPGDFLVRHRARITAIARGRVADLREITPERHAGPLEVLVQHRHDADRKIARDTAANLEKADRAFAIFQQLRRFRIIVREPRHVLDARADGVHILDFTRHHATGVHVTQRGVLPAGHDDRQVLLAGREHPGILRIDLVKLLQLPRANANAFDISKFC